MIRRGRAEGWLKEPIEGLTAWATFHGVVFNGIKIGPLPGYEDRGSAVIAKRNLNGDIEEPLMTIPKELVLSRQNIELFAKSDQHLRELLQALGDFGRTTRGAVLTFLVMQASLCCPDIKDIGVHTPLTDYIKYLPDELLPTFWTEEEHELLEGTTLRSATRAKMNSLLREFETFRTATGPISWCARYWWDEEDGLLTFDDWLRVDAMYRSRALEVPGVGDAMVPCIDMANHASGHATAALYETDDDGNALLELRQGKYISPGEEITITYGDDKGACENIFSYGFIEDTMSSAKVMFLNLDVPDDDPLRPAKIYVCNTAPGFRLVHKEDTVEWEGDFVWLVVVNEEDGIDFKVRQTVDGEKEIQAFWKESELNDASKIRAYLEKDPLWEVFQLRAVVLMQGRVHAQIERLHVVGSPEREGTVRERPWHLAARLRTLELELLRKTAEILDNKRATLLDSETIQRYLGLIDDDDDKGDEEEVDFT
ncbi:SET domain-containing protein [Bimuria novae-zelandiae CBS 107.79]|uniref:SET domain-containing protein n=1 Tax=Bimuria novae-zelandiae CBS 107.79 TaxID=1447943 RepID=A0A6A5UT63_9PLEO|nr:SET domain-containing protein [Bimuria novae-zelandiae CBS 107.79]